jgi:hypothetical protein
MPSAGPASRRPRYSTSPELGLISPPAMRSSVDLPTPSDVKGEDPGKHDLPATSAKGEPESSPRLPGNRSGMRWCRQSR